MREKKTRKIYHIKRALLPALLSVSLCFGSFFYSYASTDKSKETLQKELQQLQEENNKNKENKKALDSKKDQEKKELENIQKEQSDIKGNVDSLSGSIKSVRNQISTIQNEIVTNRQTINELAEDLNEAQAKKKDLKAKIAARMKYTYETYSTDSILVVLLSSGSMAEFMNRAEYMTQVLNYERKLLKSLDEVEATITAKQDEINGRQSELSKNHESLSAKEGELGDLLNGAKGSLSEKNEELAKQEEIVKALDEDIKAVEAEMQKTSQAQLRAQEALADAIAKEIAEKRKQEQAENGGTIDPENPPVYTGNDNAGINPALYGTYPYTEEDVRMLRALVQAESGNQGLDGQRAVASVVMNRVYSSAYSMNTIRDVIFAPKQFQPTDESMRRHYSDGSYMTPWEFYYSHEDRISDTVKQAVDEVLGGQQFICTLFFMTPAAFQSQSWLHKNGRVVVDYTQIKGHVFFNVVYQ